MKVLLAKEWDPTKHDPTGWWMSEKLDGVRAYWTGSAFVSRTGKKLHVPEWYCAGLPDHALDGEFFCGRGQFQKTVSIVRQHDAGFKAWDSVQYVLFDAPDYGGTFEERYSSLLRVDHPKVGRLNQVRCMGVEALRRALKKVESLGGEGLMLRKPGSLYERRRSGTLLKVKTFHDAEAEVVAHQPGEGKHIGRLGALVCRYGEVEFGIGTGFTDVERAAPPPVGSMVTFSYQELTKDGVPRFPVYLRRRDEVAI